MEILEQRILKDGAVKEGGILKVDSFLNHQCDIQLYNEMGKAFAAHFTEKHCQFHHRGFGHRHRHCRPVLQRGGLRQGKSLNLDSSLYSFRHSTYDKIHITVSAIRYEFGHGAVD